MNRKHILIVVLAAVALMASACGGGNGDTGADDGHDHTHDEETSGSLSFGEPAEVADADRTIKVTATDEFRFEPDHLEIKVGETIAFEFVNAGKAPHEFVLGDAAAMDEHAHGTSQPNATSTVEGGGSDTIAWTFTEAGEFIYECHVADHHKLGMRGTITVS